ncbi:hypothetical protein, partial [Nonomuraea dietziae]|uniref:hypothetical protein n=1 Tax=Nonomuraea dietziae TaxID=65515 RepID=UPI0031CDB095
HSEHVAGHLDVEVILMAYWPTPPRVGAVVPPDVPAPFRNAGWWRGVVRLVPVGQGAGSGEGPGVAFDQVADALGVDPGVRRVLAR